MSFQALYNGACADCGERFPAGTEITYDAHGSLVHYPRCPELPDDKPAGAVCPRCFCYHAGECA